MENRMIETPENWEVLAKSLSDPRANHQCKTCSGKGIHKCPGSKPAPVRSVADHEELLAKADR
jgi:hypothetical protein